MSRVRVDVQSTTRVSVSPSDSSSGAPPVRGPEREAYPVVECRYTSPASPSSYPDLQRYSSREVRSTYRDVPDRNREPPRRDYSREEYDRRREDWNDYDRQRDVDDYDRRGRAESRERPRRDRSRESRRSESPPRRKHHHKHRDVQDVERAYKIYIRRSQTRIPTSQGSRSMVDQATADKLEAGFKRLQDSKDCHSLLKKYLTRDVFDRLKGRKTAMGATLLDVIQSGVQNLDSGVGIYAPDAESYTVFADLFNPVIEDYHGGFKATDRHPPTDFGDVNTLQNLDPGDKFVISTRVRCGRSLQGYPFNPCLTEAQYKEMEAKVRSTLSSLEGELKGTYHPLTGMDKKTQQQLIDDHFLFKEGDRFLQAANACRYWPTGRGIYHNAAKTFLVWCNEEDHLRIISMQKGGDLKTIYARLVNAVNQIEAKLPFSRDDRLGFLTFCPTNLGTTIRASVHIKLPKLAADLKKLEGIAAKYNLQVRGTRGEHTESEGGVYDISNKRRLGLTEYQAVREMHDGILELIKMEQAA